MKISEIYNQYRIIPNLQLHQLRVAAVAKQISDNMIINVDNASIVTAALLHDMGNIIKFDLNVFPDFLEPEGLEYWKKVKKSFHRDYGDDEHLAHIEIAKELKIDDKVIEIINNVGFSKSKANYENSSYENKIVAYSDMRVTPFKVVSLEERVYEGRKRYDQNTGEKSVFTEFEENYDYLKKIERQIFENNKLKPLNINDESTNQLIDILEKYEV